MKQPLMLAPMRVPPAQAEILCDVLEESGRMSAPDVAAWPGEDWDDDVLSAYRPMPPPEAGKGRVAQH